MKKLFLAMAFFAMVSSASFAQMTFGGGITLGSKVSLNDDLSEKMGIGLNVCGNHAFNDQWSVSPGFTLFFPSVPGDASITMWQINADAHYSFAESGDFKFYGVGGLNYSYVKVESIDDSKIGINLGAGTNYGKFFGELKYDTAFEQFAISVGIHF